MISIIIPVYNVNSYLHRCIQSIVNQTYPNWELILVNDGSTDTSGDICDEYALTDERILVIHKYNEGVSSARNVGIDCAKGEYISFIDADDVLETNALQKFIEIYDSKTEVYICSYIRTYPDGAVVEFNRCKALNVCVGNGQEILALMYKNNSYECSVWANIYSRQFIKEYQILFDNQLTRHEDEAWFLKVLLLAKYVRITDLIICHTFAGRIGSLSNIQTYKGCRSKIYLSNIVLSDCELMNIDKSLRKRIEKAMSSFYLRGICEANNLSKVEKKQIYKIARKNRYILKKSVSFKQRVSSIILWVVGFNFGGRTLSRIYIGK